MSHDRLVYLHSIPPVSYLARTESRGSQGGHGDHGDNNLDGGRGGCHFGYFVLASVPVPSNMREFGCQNTMGIDLQLLKY
jgi:hypothetical protein